MSDLQERLKNAKAVKIKSGRLGVDVWLVTGVDAARDVYRAGHRDAIYFEEEIPSLQQAPDQALDTIQAIKLVFPGCTVGETVKLARQPQDRPREQQQALGF